MFRGAIFNYNAQARSRAAIRPFTETLRFSRPADRRRPRHRAGLPLGLFNIGGQGQLLIGAACSPPGRASSCTCPTALHLIVATLFGFVGAALWAEHRRLPQGQDRGATR